MHATEQLLADVAKDVLGNLAFMSFQKAKRTSRPEEAWVRAGISFEGPFNGRMTLGMPRRLLVELAGNMLGEEEDGLEAEKHGLDALGELANVICGNLLAKMAGPQLTFPLSAPRLTPNPGVDAESSDGVPAASAWLVMDEGWLEAALHLEA